MHDKLSSLLDTALQNYDFGDNIMVTDINGWESDGGNDYISILYVEFTDEPNPETHKVSFHVLLNDKKTAVVEAYALLTEDGNMIGSYQ